MFYCVRVRCAYMSVSMHASVPAFAHAWLPVSFVRCIVRASVSVLYASLLVVISRVTTLQDVHRNFSQSETERDREKERGREICADDTKGGRREGERERVRKGSF